jgi:hypothetical protein
LNEEDIEYVETRLSAKIVEAATSPKGSKKGGSSGGAKQALLASKVNSIPRINTS